MVIWISVVSVIPTVGMVFFVVFGMICSVGRVALKIRRIGVIFRVRTTR